MNSAILEQKETYHEVNSITGRANSVIFGGELLAELPVAELVHNFGLNISVCNRSVDEAVLADAFELLDECVYELRPARVFLNFGETDMKREGFSMEAFLADYRRLISEISAHVKCSIFIISVISAGDEAHRLNAQLRSLARECGCCFVNVEDVFAHEKPHLRLFSELIHYMREGRIGFSDAMHFCEA